MTTPEQQTDEALAALRDELVAARALGLRLLERLSEIEARSALEEVLAAEKRVAETEIMPLTLWSEIPEKTFGVQSRQHPRIRRVLDYVVPGDRIVDIGPSYGYLTGFLLRDAWIDSYTGIDVSERALESIKAMTVANGIADRPIHLEKRSIFDVDADFLDHHRPDLVLVLEVLEHLDDPEGAIAAVARAMSGDQSLLFSVPVLGRLEQVWGHRSLFDSTRVVEMCRRNGLTVQHVEAVHNIWTLVLATPSPTPPARLLRLARRRTDGIPLPGSSVPSTHFTDLDLATAVAPAKRGPADGAVEISREGKSAIRCNTTGKGRTRGVALPLTRPYRLRLELSFSNPAAIEAVDVEGLDAEGSRTLRWTWRPGRGPGLPETPTTYVLAPGRAARAFRPTADAAADRTATVRIGLTVADGETAAVVVHRAGVLPTA